MGSVPRSQPCWPSWGRRTLSMSPRGPQWHQSASIAAICAIPEHETGHTTQVCAYGTANTSTCTHTHKHARRHTHERTHEGTHTNAHAHTRTPRKHAHAQGSTHRVPVRCWS